MKKLIMVCILLSLVACTHKPIATPNEVNDYLNKITERSTFDFLDQVNNDNVII